MAYKRLMREQVTEDRWREVVNAMLDKARDGDVQAAKWLSDILIPKVAKVAGGATLNLAGADVQKRIDLLFGLVASVESADDDSDPA